MFSYKKENVREGNMRKIITDIYNKKYFYIENINKKSKNSFFVNNNIEDNIINCYPGQVITIWYGMGGAITESSSYNYSLLNEEQRNQFLQDYYSKEGLNYNYARIPIGSNDFSLNSYQYAQKKDLSDFCIDRDKEYIINLLDKVYKTKKLKLIATPWSPPSFMKNNKSLYRGKLKENYYELYAKYLGKYIENYNLLGYNIDYLTMQNEPFAEQKWESCFFSIEEQKNFLYRFLLKELQNYNTKVLLWDHNKHDLYNIVNKLYFPDEKIEGIGVHWYSGGFYNNIKLIKQRYPELLVFNTEMCCGYSNYEEIQWINDAELYLSEIMSDMNAGLNAFIDWNILLDFNGGPSHKGNYVKSPIILNKEKNNYIKTPIYYYLKHISLIEENSKIVQSDIFDRNKQLLVVASKNNDKLLVTILNKSHEKIKYNILLDEDFIKDSICPHSVVTYEI